MLNRSIRKISVGLDVNNQLHLSVGSKVMGVEIETIKEVTPSHYEVWIKKEDNGIMPWKSFVGMPVIIEYNTRLE